MQEAQERAIKNGHLPVVQLVHERIIGIGPDRCGCSPVREVLAVRRDRVNVLEWFYASGCRVRFGSTNVAYLVDEAVKHDSVHALQWIIDKTPVGKRPIDWNERATARMIAKSGARCIALLHESGVCPFTPQMLHHAAQAYRMDIVKWAAAEPVDAVPVPRSEPVPAWYSGYAAWGFLGEIQTRSKNAEWCRDDEDAIEWMAQRPDAKRLFVPAMVRMAIHCGAKETVSILAKAGICRFDEWDALSVAVETRDLPMIKIVANAGAPLTVQVFVEAMRMGVVRNVAYLLRRYDGRHVQQAFDTAAMSGAFRSSQEMPVWLSRNVPGLCTASLWCASQMGLVSAQLCANGIAPCRCARCASSSTH